MLGISKREAQGSASSRSSSACMVRNDWLDQRSWCLMLLLAMLVQLLHYLRPHARCDGGSALEQANAHLLMPDTSLFLRLLGLCLHEKRAGVVRFIRWNAQG